MCNNETLEMRNRHHRIRINIQDKDKTYSGVMYLSFNLPEGESDSSGIKVLTLPRGSLAFLFLFANELYHQVSQRRSHIHILSGSLCIFYSCTHVSAVIVWGLSLGDQLWCQLAFIAWYLLLLLFLTLSDMERWRRTSQLHKILVKTANFRQCSLKK